MHFYVKDSSTVQIGSKNNIFSTLYLGFEKSDNLQHFNVYCWNWAFYCKDYYKGGGVCSGGAGALGAPAPLGRASPPPPPRPSPFLVPSAGASRRLDAYAGSPGPVADVLLTLLMIHAELPGCGA